MQTILLIFLGGGLGSVFRYYLAHLLNQQLPYGTWLVNILGSLIIGWVLGMYEGKLMSERFYLLMAVGFCGGFTTFSSFAAENLAMLQQQAYLSFILYTLLSISVGLGMVALGYMIGKGVGTPFP